MMDTGGLRRSHILDEPPDLIDWDRIHDLIQTVLGRLAGEIAGDIPQLATRSGRMAGGPTLLFSYMLFYNLDGDDFDPVVVGITFSRQGVGVRMSGDISGDETGIDYFHDESCVRLSDAD